jgi:hypothetical protein
MPIKQRHGAFDAGAVTTGNQSAWFSLGSFTKAVVLAEADASGCTVNVQTTNDPDGSNVYTLSALQLVLGASEANSIQVNPCPRFLRISVTGAGDLVTSYIDAIREIA